MVQWHLSILTPPQNSLLSLVPATETLTASTPEKSAAAQPGQHPSDDDPLDCTSSLRNNRYGGFSSQSQYIVAPSVSVRSEFANITRTSAPIQPLTCIISPGCPVGGRIPSRVLGTARQPVRPTGPSARQIHKKQSVEGSTPSCYAAQIPPMSAPAGLSSHQHQCNSGGSSGGGESPFQSITDGLMQRISDWKGHPMSGLGPLQMFDILSVRRDVLVRELHVYLFKEAIICVIEEKKKGLGRLWRWRWRVDFEWCRRQRQRREQ